MQKHWYCPLKSKPLLALMRASYLRLEQVSTNLSHWSSIKLATVQAVM